MLTPAQAKAISELLAFHLEAGVDALVGEEPGDRLGPDRADEAVSAPAAAEVAAKGLGWPAESNTLVRPLPAAGSQASGRSAPSGHSSPTGRELGGAASFAPAHLPEAPAGAETMVMAAREAARRAENLDELATILAGFEGCALKKTATKLVFADGNPAAPLMFVGEAPGADEDREGLPFVGRSGRLLDQMMAAIGLERKNVYIANIIPWRPPGNRTPTPLESQICLPFILRQIELADPDILVCLGAPATQALLGLKDGIMRTRGRWFSYATGRREIRAMPTLHPAYLLRQPLAKRLAWRDFLAIKAALSDRRP